MPNSKRPTVWTVDPKHAWSYFDADLPQGWKQMVEYSDHVAEVNRLNTQIQVLEKMLAHEQRARRAQEDDL